MSAAGGRTVRALTLHQPWASLVAFGVKTVETRSWRTSYRGPLAIHAGMKVPEMTESRVGTVVGDYEAWPADDPNRPHPNYPDGRPARLYPNEGRYPLQASWVPLPLGAVVATCTLADCVPMVDHATWTNQPLGEVMDRHGGACLMVDDYDLGLWHRRPGRDGHNSATRTGLNDQRPYGDFAPGRWAWLLTDVVRLDEPSPAKGKQGLWEWTP